MLYGEDNTALHYASIGGQVPVIKVLLNQPGVDVDVRDILGRTPLMCAARYGRVEAVKTLLEAGATPQNKDDFGLSVIDWTAELETSEIADILNEAIESKLS